jgi:hypothetical protein
MTAKNKNVKSPARLLFLGALILGGCQTAHDVAVSSFRVIDAPRQFVRRQMGPDENPTTTTTTTTTVDSDAVTPGHPVDVTRERREAERRRVAKQGQPNPASSPGASPRVTRNTSAEKAKPSPTPAKSSASSQASQIPTAKPVPGKPGYVFSPFDPSGGYVDVNGYASGSKVKDPYSGKVFLVP